MAYETEATGLGATWDFGVECKILVERADFGLDFIIASRVISNTSMSSVKMKKHWLERACDITSSSTIQPPENVITCPALSSNWIDGSSPEALCLGKLNKHDLIQLYDI